MYKSTFVTLSYNFWFWFLLNLKNLHHISQDLSMRKEAYIDVNACQCLSLGISI